MGATEHGLVDLVRAELAQHPEIAPDPVCVWTKASNEQGLRVGAEAERRNAWPYHLAGYLASVELGMGPTAAAKMIGRDRKTLYHGVPRIEDRRDDPEFDAFIERLAELARASLSQAALDELAAANDDGGAEEPAPRQPVQPWLLELLRRPGGVALASALATFGLLQRGAGSPGGLVEESPRAGSLTFGSVCSGIEAASVAWQPLGWRAAWLAETEAFPSAVLAHHYPATPNLGDMNAIAAAVMAGEVHAPDILVGGTPCQAFSVAGMRGGLSDERGGLTLAYVETLNAIDAARSVRGQRPAVSVWENVPGVLSMRDNAFGCFLGALAGEDCELQPPGARWTDAGVVLGPQRAIAWRVLDAQYFGLAQRRRRVFVVSSARTGFDPGAVLFERDGVRRDSPPRREAGQADRPAAGGAAARGGSGAESDGGLIVPILDGAKGRTDKRGSRDGRGLGAPGDPMFTLRAGSAHAVAFALRGREGGAMPEVHGDGQTVGTLRAASGGSSRDMVAFSTGVRRLMPIECERLQGLPQGYTAVPWGRKAAPDTGRYTAIGNSMAVPVMRWIGERIVQAMWDAA